MASFFLAIYQFFRRQKLIFTTVFVGSILLLAFLASGIKIEEDITGFFPDDERVEKLNYVFKNSSLTERMVIMISSEDSTQEEQPDSLVSMAADLAGRIPAELGQYVKKMTAQVDDEKVLALFESVKEYMPVFLEEKDYVKLDSLCRAENAKNRLADNYNQLISPSGILTKRIIAEDPMGFSFMVLAKLQQLQFDENFELYDGYVVTKDHRHLLLFIQAAIPAGETGKNAVFIDGLKTLLASENAAHGGTKATSFGAAEVAAGNASQMRRDTFLTLGLMLILLMVFIVGYFRKKRVPFLILIPVFFGALFSIACIYLFKGTISILAIAAGSVILGIAVNYSLHFLSHLKHTRNVREVISDLAVPMTLGSATTVLAFFSLQFANASVLRDVGLFAGFSLIGAALCSLIFLPQIVSADLFRNEKHNRENWIDRVSHVSLERRKLPLLIILLATPVFFYFAGQVTFNTDMRSLNYMDEETRDAEQMLEKINQAGLSSVYVVAEGQNIEAALRRSEQMQPVLSVLKEQGKVVKFSSVSSFMISDSLQRVRLDRWNSFWTQERKSALVSVVRQEGTLLGFSQSVLQNFESLLNRKFNSIDQTTSDAIRSSFFDDFIIEDQGRVTIVTPLSAAGNARAEVFQQLAENKIAAFDRQLLTNIFIEYVHQDFNFIVAITALIVFIALLLAYGRIELTLITFLPMLITWIWILGIMALVGIQFNIVNVMVSTFIFGLGDDYSIFTMDGLLQEYKTGKKNLPSVRVSIILSVLTTISGLGVLIFAQHPALRSIAAISIIGIVCVFVMSQTIAPFIFRWLITNRTDKGLQPMTLIGLLRSTMTYTLFVFGSFFLTIIGLAVRVIPFGKKQQQVFFHWFISLFGKIVIDIDPLMKRRREGITPEVFSTPSVIISNHSSFLDILLSILLNPKVVLLTNKWVWNSWIFGGVVRLAGYYSVDDGAEESIEHLQRMVNDGYSIVVFPEGSRSPDGKIRRFHKGAFFLAEQLKIPIRPLLIHGASDSIPKHSMHVNQGFLSLKMLPAIEPTDESFGRGYTERTKSISRYFKKEHAEFAKRLETCDYYAHPLITNYLYKGPILEWYMRVKLRLERNYKMFDELIPKNASVLDLGCGYGFLAYMLHYTSQDRTVTGVDYDAEKIEVAQHCYSRSARISFFHADVTKFDQQHYDAIILADVMHYLPSGAQDELLIKCFSSLNAGGKVILRDGDIELRERHRGTRITEFFSVKLLKFNKAENSLNYVRGSRLKELAAIHGLNIEVLDETRRTSNVVFVFTRGKG